MANYPEITYRFPTEVNGSRSELRPEIILDWSADMETTQFSNDAERAKNLVLMDDATSTILETDYVSYTASSKRLIVKPSTDLDRGKRFRIIVKNRLSSTEGRRSSNEYNWSFLTASGAITAPTLLSPADASVQPVFPSLVWSTVSATGTISYLVELGERWDFSTLAYTATTTASSLTPAGSFDSSTTFFWRVKASTASATGAWSDVRSFYYGSIIPSDPSSTQTFPETGIFDVDTTFKSGVSHQASYPTLSITFTSPPASTYSSYIQAIKKSVLPRNDDEDSYDENTWSGTWSLSGSVITFTPSEAIATNTRYEIKLLAGMRSQDGYELGREFVYYLTGKYSPFYCSPRVIRSRFLGAEQQVPDDLINFYIYMSSLEANARYHGYFENPYMDTIGDSLSETTVRDSSKLTSFGVLKWVEAATAYKLLKAILMENLRDVGRTTRLGDGLVSLSADFIKGIEKALEEIKEEINQWEDYLVPSDIPMSTSKGAEWSPHNWDYDWSLGRSLGRRDDW